MGTQYHMGIRKQLYGELIHEQELTRWWEGNESASPGEDKENFQTLDLTHSATAPFLGPCDTSSLPLIKTYYGSIKKTYKNDTSRSKSVDSTLNQ